MEIFVCQLENLNAYPPTISLIHNLVRNGYKVTLISLNIPEAIVNKYEALKINVINIKMKNLYFKLFNKMYTKYLVIKMIKENCPPQSVLWTTTDYTAATIREILWNYKHVMQLMELIEDFPISTRLPFKANLARYARQARCVVVPEYNRAHIQKTWWKLQRLPFLLPNKPAWHPKIKKEPLSKAIPIKIHEMLNQLSNKKIILYQGAFGVDRRLDVIAEAVKLLGNDYCFLLMGEHCDTVQQLINNYQNTVYHIDFIAPPDHLYVTGHAHIGVLSYVTDKPCIHYSILNALYCAPNKLYEYAGFGLPMVGNDLPGLKSTIEANHMGVCASDMTPQAFVNAFLQVEMHYDELSLNSSNFYNAMDMDKLVDDIIKYAAQ